MSKDLSWLRTLPGSPLIVAEIKQRSPYGWISPLSWREQLTICEEYGDIISVHTNPLWGGSWEHLAYMRSLTTKPILAKGFHDTIHDVRRALDCGADHVLTVGWWPTGEYRCWHECETIGDVSRSGAAWVVWNARNPRTGHRRSANCTMQEARDTRPEKPICQASMIRGPQDVHPSANAILIGEGLYTSPPPGWPARSHSRARLACALRRL